MRRVGQALLLLSLVGCSRENPWFALKGAGQESTTGTASDGTEGSSGGTRGSDSGPDDTTAGESGTSAAMTSTSTSTSTTGPSTTSSSTSSSTTGDTSTGDTSTGDTSGSSGSSTGDLEENVLYDLFELCPTTAVWSDLQKSYPCGAFPTPPISVSQTKVLYQAKNVSGIIVYPAQIFGEYLDGVYELMLMDAVNPRFRAVLLFPPDAGIKDAIVGQIYVESVKSGATVLSAPPIMLMPGDTSMVDLDLSGVQGEVAGLLLHLQVTIATPVATTKSRAVWLGPRVVEAP